MGQRSKACIMMSDLPPHFAAQIDSGRMLVETIYRYAFRYELSQSDLRTESHPIPFDARLQYYRL